MATLGSSAARALVLVLALTALAFASRPVKNPRPSKGVSATQEDPVVACSSCFINGEPPANVPSPHNADLVPLCHAKGKSVFFFTIYDPSVFHSLMSISLVRHATLPKCVGGRRTFDEDPQLTAMKVPQISPEASGNGYDAKWNRGHLGPSELFSYDKSEGGAFDQCYYDTNIAPQWYQLNQIGWRLLEANIFHWSETNQKDIFVITGTWYNSTQIRKFSSGLSIPDYYYKVICDGSSSSAFAGKNVEGTTGMESMEYMTVSSWQDATGIDFKLPASCNIDRVDPKYWSFTHEPPAPYPPPAL